MNIEILYADSNNVKHFWYYDTKEIFRKGQAAKEAVHKFELENPEATLLSITFQ